MFQRVALLLVACTAFAADRWDIQYSYHQPDSVLTLNDLAFPTASRGVACGFTTSRSGEVRPLVLLTADAGKHWTEQPVREGCLSLMFLDESLGWMVTEKGIWRTVESGRSWTRLTKAPAGMLTLHFLDRTHGFAAGLQKRVFETKDAGETWSLLPIVREIPSDTDTTTFGAIAFSGDRGIISGWNIPPVKGGPDWMEAKKAEARKQVPTYTVLLQTVDGGRTWTKSEAALFGQATRMSLTAQGTGMGLVEFRDEFDYPSEVYRINPRSGRSDRVYRTKDRAITDVRLFDGFNQAVIAGYETLGKIYRSPIPGKLKVLSTSDGENWDEAEVDYRAVARRAFIAGPDPDHVWIGTDTGSILNLVK